MKFKEFKKKQDKLSKEFNKDFEDLKDLHKIRLSLARSDFFNSSSSHFIVYAMCVLSLVIILNITFFVDLFSTLLLTIGGTIIFVKDLYKMENNKLKGWEHLIEFKNKLIEKDKE